VPPPPALGGIRLNGWKNRRNERRPGFEIPLRTAPMGRRLAAAGIDATLVMGAIRGFTYIFFKITAEMPSLAKTGRNRIFSCRRILVRLPVPLAGLQWRHAGLEASQAGVATV